MNVGDKKYYENYARISLIGLYNKNLLNAKLEDKPDIQDEISDIGIEVTRADLKNECMAASITNKFFGKNLSLDELEACIKSDFKTFDGKIGEIEGVNYISPSKGMIDYKSKLDKIIDAIANKTKKFKENYTKFKENDLYIFTMDSCITLSDIKKIMKNEIISRCPFDNIFINCIDRIYICNKREIKEIEISSAQLKKFKKEAINLK